MSAQTKIKTRCPVCKAAYAVPNNSVGHRARCPKCDSVFRVLVPGVQPAEAEPQPPPEVTSHRPGQVAAPRTPEAAARRHRPPGEHGASDDDIVAWLMEGSERDDLPEQPRRWQAPAAPESPVEPPQAQRASA